MTFDIDYVAFYNEMKELIMNGYDFYSALEILREKYGNK